MDGKNTQIDRETFENLLYLSRLSPQSTDTETLAAQVRQIVDYFGILSRFSGEGNPYDAYPATTVENLRDDTVLSGLEQQDLKHMTAEFMDGYFRVPKVLGGGA
ncbi:MAG: Asp-tRNA(Asn)/Glu-tRNA(Gln) amidotransferase subunit GatC [Spirochaetes bacterium]|uniref:Glutamyl-tRNA(Gln) amidotransferase subunit C n=1 Tax=Candidatus Avitreponema avistercoris TaxID=2840705 RepID=A0A9D9EN48_9SPIR|nr:Asp-tRNA(Asn)/Glu-tRNA(Gln) amidotransferase subunit GatC [Candidatus Avitreponema avistercoris]